MYAALTLSAGLVAGDHLHELFPPVFRAMAALGLAFAVARPDGRFDRWAVAFFAWFIATGAITVAGQLWQRLVDDGTGNYVLIDPVFLTVSASSTLLLAIGALSLYGAKRAAT